MKARRPRLSSPTARAHPARRWALFTLPILAGVLLTTGALAAEGVPAPRAIVLPPDFAATCAGTCVDVPVNIDRNDTGDINIKLISVTFQLSAGLELCDGLGSITEGTYMSGFGSPTTFFAYSNGGGSYTADCGINGSTPVCGAPSGSDGTVFTVRVRPTGAELTNTVTVTSITVRNCLNATLATDGVGSDVSIPVSSTPITLSPVSGALPGAVVGTPYSQFITASGGVPPYVYSISAGSLPPGLTIDPVTGEISGTPTDDGSYAFTVTATDANLCTGSADYTLDVTCPTITLDPLSGALPGGTTGTPYSQFISASGGTPPYTYAVTAGSLPPGLTLDPNTGEIVGTPTAAGPYAFTVTATDIYGCAGSADYTIDVACQTVTLTPSSGALPGADTSTPYSQFISASGGTGPYTYAITAGSLPPGLTLDPTTGEISGTPTALGIFNFTVTATDANNCTGSADYSIEVVCGAITLSPAPGALPGGSTGTPYSQFIVANGGTPPYDYQVTAGALPGGLTLNSSTGEIAGTPTVFGPFAFTVTATDVNGCTGSAAYTLDVTCPTITLSPAAGPLPPGTTGTPYSQFITPSGGTPPYTFAITAGNLPDGLTLDPNTGEIAGTPDPPGGLFTFTVTVTDANGCTGSAEYSILVDCPPISLPQVLNLTATQVIEGNGTDGLTGIMLTFNPNGAPAVQVFRKGFGGYPQYDENGGVEPGPPSSHAQAVSEGWALTGVTASGQVDEPPTRDFWYYVAYAVDPCNNAGVVSNKTFGRLNYHLCDFHDGTTDCQGDNLVNAHDIGFLGFHYGIVLPINDPLECLDVGPTTDGSVHARPTTDNLINFEDLMMCLMNWNSVGAPQVAPRLAASGVNTLALGVPPVPAVGDVMQVALVLNSAGDLQGLSARLDYNHSALEFLGAQPGPLLGQQVAPGLALSGGDGVVDAAVMGSGATIQGSGELAYARFRVVATGQSQISVASVTGRDVNNQDIPISTEVVSVRGRDVPATTQLAPPSPNPSDRMTTLSFALAKPGHVDLVVFGVDGRRIRTLVSEVRDAGTYNCEWNGRDDYGRAQPAGVYFIRMITADSRLGRTLVMR